MEPVLGFLGGIVVGSILVMFIFFMENRTQNFRRKVEEQMEKQGKEAKEQLKYWEKELGVKKN